MFVTQRDMGSAGDKPAALLSSARYRRSSAVAGHVRPVSQAQPGTFPTGADPCDWAGD